jgi:hypothetical protein
LKYYPSLLEVSKENQDKPVSVVDVLVEILTHLLLNMIQEHYRYAELFYEKYQIKRSSGKNE